MDGINLIRNIYYSKQKNRQTIISSINSITARLKRKQQISSLKNIKNELVAIHADHETKCNKNKPCTYIATYRICYEELTQLISNLENYKPWYKTTWVVVSASLTFFGLILAIIANGFKINDSLNTKLKNYSEIIDDQKSPIIVIISNNLKLDTNNNMWNRKELIEINGIKLLTDEINLYFKGKVIDLKPRDFLYTNDPKKITFKDSMNNKLSNISLTCNNIGSNYLPIQIFYEELFILKTKAIINLIDTSNYCNRK